MKTVRVRITKKVANFTLGGVTYLPGDVLEVPANQYHNYFMEKLPKKKPKPAEEPVATFSDEQPVTTNEVTSWNTLPTVEKPKTKPRKRRSRRK